MSAIWGESQKHDEAFALLWGSAENEWLAVYKMSILVRKCPSLSFLIERCERLWVALPSRDVNQPTCPQRTIRRAGHARD